MCPHCGLLVSSSSPCCEAWEADESQRRTLQFNADREELCRILHDANTGGIVPDSADSTRYGAMAEAVLGRIGGRLPVVRTGADAL